MYVVGPNSADGPSIRWVKIESSQNWIRSDRVLSDGSELDQTGSGSMAQAGKIGWDWTGLDLGSVYWAWIDFKAGITNWFDWTQVQFGQVKIDRYRLNGQTSLGYGLG
ncbi:hypothetical protein V6N12_011489 [Hibiscus sabdariffa]|uniref:Uncharacterized protein n=1 Tax=Hibiscus sabdariffa TaxID=183260 RepID=A0ABR2B277_9ROSI